MKTDSYFQNYTYNGDVKFYKLNSAPTIDETFIAAEFTQRRQPTGWANFSAIFSIYGKPNEWKTLYEVANELQRCLKTINLHCLGGYLLSEGEDPVRERVVLNISVSFGGVIQ